jgi:hypothetical protein
MRKIALNLPPKLSHQWIDLVDLAVHRAIVRKIRREPNLYRRAIRTVARWEKRRRVCPPQVREWKQILQNNDREAVLQLLTREDGEGQRLRSTAPFCGVLTNKEVRAVWARYE